MQKKISLKQSFFLHRDYLKPVLISAKLLSLETAIKALRLVC